MLMATGMAVAGIGLLLTNSASAAPSPTGAIPKACYLYGTLLAGKVQVVTTPFGSPTDSVPTFKVQRVTAFPDLKVQEVRNFPTNCGQWQYVNSSPDFKVRFVRSFPDFKVQFVRSFPGVP
jgi:hypothetical protein